MSVIDSSLDVFIELGTTIEEIASLLVTTPDVIRGWVAAGPIPQWRLRFWARLLAVKENLTPDTDEGQQYLNYGATYAPTESD